MKELLYPIFLLLYSTGISGQATISLNSPRTAGGTETACQSITLKPGFSFVSATGKSLTLTVNPTTCDPFGGNMATITPDKLYIRTKTFTNTEGTRYLDEIQYFDDYGRPDQLVQRGITPSGADLVTARSYDFLNRVELSMLPFAKAGNNGAFSIPDGLGRMALTGTCKNTFDSQAGKPNLIYEEVKAIRTNATDACKGYTISGITLTTPTILSVNYYDDYAFLGYNTIPNTTNTQYTTESGYGVCYGDHQAANKVKNKGLLTGTLTAQMNTDGTVPSAYLYSVMYYDNRGRLIQAKSNNHLAGGIDEEHIAYNFTGQPVRKIHIHSVTGKNTQTEVYAYTYDHAGRLLKTTHQLTDGTTVKPQVTLAENTYDELGRLKTNKKGGVAGTLATYTYNVRSWTKNITSPLFNQTLYYNDKVTVHTYSDYQQMYNGNISGMEWQLKDESKRSYRFKYDKLSRLTHAAYNGVTNGGMYNVAYAYDKHGNMSSLTRRGKSSAAADNNALVDQLSITYVGNQMTHVSDAVVNFAYAESADFKDKVSASGTIEYTYNANGAMNKDLNKGITEIQYNSLNLPRQMVINSPTAKAKNYYTYSASGVKLRTEQRYDPTLNSSPLGTTTPTNDGLSDYKNTDYAGNIIYETVKSGSTITNKTRILVDGGYIEGGVYYYYLTDHLGNNRVVANASGTIIQRNHYYPFGMSFADTPLAEQGKQPYKYNGKELDQMHGLNMYDYSARYKDDFRFTTVDPLAEEFYSWSPYAYALNNPMKYIDPDGKFPIIPIIIIVGLLLNSDVVVAPTGNPSDGAKIQEARNDYNMNNLGILVPLPGGSGANTLSNTVGKQFLKEGGKQAEKQVIKEVEKQVVKQVGEDIINGPVSQYTKSTTTRKSGGYRKQSSSIPNRETNVTKAEFGDNLVKSNYTKSTSKDGKVTNYTKGDKKYTVRENAKSTGGTTADYSKNNELKKKIRLGD